MNLPMYVVTRSGGFAPREIIRTSNLRSPLIRREDLTICVGLGQQTAVLSTA